MRFPMRLGTSDGAVNSIASQRLFFFIDLSTGAAVSTVGQRMFTGGSRAFPRRARRFRPNSVVPPWFSSAHARADHLLHALVAQWLSVEAAVDALGAEAVVVEQRLELLGEELPVREVHHAAAGA